MWKIGIIVILGFFSAGCSVIRNKSNRNLEISKELVSENILKRVINQNVTNIDFFIQKAEIEIINSDRKEKYVGSIKFLHPDKYLISIKSRTGIEGARIYISGDSMLINDRINRKVYSVSALFLKRKYGISKEFLPLFFGDVVMTKNSEEEKTECSGDKINFECAVKGLLINYEISCKKAKTILAKENNNSDLRNIEIKYEKFMNIDNLLMPQNIELLDSKENFRLRVRIVKIKKPWSGKIEFIPGRGYEIIELL